MASLSIYVNPNCNSSPHCSTIHNCFRIGNPRLNFSATSRPNRRSRGQFSSASSRIGRFRLRAEAIDDEEVPEEGLVESLRVPEHWLEPSTALKESEWLRVTLHKWLDDEYCPEVTNVDISNVAAQSYYKSLLEKQTDLGEILITMARELESISYQESFHGAFSSANAAISLITQRIED